MCQGVSFCDGDEQICDKDLECLERKKKIVRRNIEESYSCFDSDFSFSFSEIKNNGSYDRIDRSDEDINTIVVSTRLDINYTALKYCSVDEQDGVMCNNHCRKSNRRDSKHPPGCSSLLYLMSTHFVQLNFYCKGKIEGFLRGGHHD